MSSSTFNAAEYQQNVDAIQTYIDGCLNQLPENTRQAFLNKWESYAESLARSHSEYAGKNHPDELTHRDNELSKTHTDALRKILANQDPQINIEDLVDAVISVTQMAQFIKDKNLGKTTMHISTAGSLVDPLTPSAQAQIR